MVSPLLEKTVAREKKYETLSVSLPVEIKSALANHFTRKGDISRYFIYLIEKDLSETNCKIVDGVIVNTNQFNLQLADETPFPDVLDKVDPKLPEIEVVDASYKKKKSS